MATLLTHKRDYRKAVMVNKSRICRPLVKKPLPMITQKTAEEPVSTTIASNVREILSVASRVASMPDREAMQRYHSLTDKSLVGSLSPSERFELERIEARLDAADRDQAIEARDREMEAERARILDSIHALLARLKQ